MTNNFGLRALVLSPTPTWPLNFGNRKRIFEVCSKLKLYGFEIHFIHYASEMDWRSSYPFHSAKKMAEQWDCVDHVFPTIPLHDSPKKNDDHEIDEWWDPTIGNHLAALFKLRTYDLFIVNYSWLSKALEFAPSGVFKVLDTHDKFSGRRKLLEKNNISREFFHTTESEELIALNRPDICWAIKEEERLAFEKMGASSIVDTIIHVDSSRDSLIPPSDKGLIFGFVGAANNINKRNIEEFIGVASPIFQRYLPPIIIKIAGSICSVLDVPSSPYFVQTGYVDDIDDFYDEIHVAIVPMRFSTGLKIKVAEALSQSKPLLATAHAMEGFDSGFQCHQIDSFEQMALKMCEIAYEPAKLPMLKTQSETVYRELLANMDASILRTVGMSIENIGAIVILPAKMMQHKALSKLYIDSRCDWLSWVYKNTVKIVVGIQSECVEDGTIRAVSEAGLELLLARASGATVFNLDPDLSQKVDFRCNRVVSVCDLAVAHESNLTVVNSCASASSSYLPIFGHKINGEEFTGLSYDSVWLLDGGLVGRFEQVLLQLYPGESYLRLSEISLCQLNELVMKKQFPKALFFDGSVLVRSFTTQLLIDLLYGAGVEMLDVSKPFELGGSKTTAERRQNYQDEFYLWWKDFESQLV